MAVISQTITDKKKLIMRTVIDLWGYCLIPTYLKNKPSCLFTTFIEKHNMQVAPISKIYPVICIVRATIGPKPKTSKPKFPRERVIVPMIKVRTKTTWRMFARFIVFKILTLFSSWDLSYTWTRSNRISSPSIVGFVKDDRIYNQNLVDVDT